MLHMWHSMAQEEMRMRLERKKFISLTCPREVVTACHTESLGKW